MFKIKKNDTVAVITGKDRGKKGRVIAVFTDANRALVEGVNFAKKHMRKTQQNQQGGIAQKEMPIHLSNLMLVCKRCNKPVRVGFSVLKDGSKTRACKSCGELI
ncbi:MAG: 50S ribosomal protein L24 [Candidatus Omnitrophica bacterium]|nr:50S ribosomal protein L24 [Candidatus Omnitrophota bacterium]MDD5352212.1 50S ribosomal protein L24 [Candidatus Omnitrophota bacterium]MDD5549810.1 50S ribosomal protein L24 [Candidatus Omnitrophota bacterium]